MDIRTDDILAALLLSLASLRWLEVKSAPARDDLGAAFAEWKQRAQRVYSRVAMACVAKVVLNVGTNRLAVGAELSRVWIVAVSASIFLLWVGFMVWSWREATEVAHLRRSLGIVLRRSRRPAPAPSK